MHTNLICIHMTWSVNAVMLIIYPKQMHTKLVHNIKAVSHKLSLYEVLCIFHLISKVGMDNCKSDSETQKAIFMWNMS